MHSDDNTEFLVHHGIKGMKWGVRRERKSSGSSGVSRKERKAINKAYRQSPKRAEKKYGKKKTQEAIQKQKNINSMKKTAAKSFIKGVGPAVGLVAYTYASKNNSRGARVIQDLQANGMFKDPYSVAMNRIKVDKRFGR